LYHLLGGKKAGYTPVVAKLDEGGTHWWIKDSNGKILDVTAAQFGNERIPYEKGKSTGFLTKHPSKRSLIVIERIMKNNCTHTHKNGKDAYVTIDLDTYKCKICKKVTKV
jgi:hypothetical protein